MSTGPGPETEQFPPHVSDLPELARHHGDPNGGQATRSGLTADDSFVLPSPELLLAADADAPLGDLPPEAVLLEREIRPLRRLRWWQILPIALVGILGSLMFAFPLAFGSGSGGAMVGMLGLLLTAASVGWGAMAARRADYALPGLPRRGSGRRASWRAIVVYTLLVCAALALAVTRVVHLRG
ncbi:hypothetical protein P3T36_005555 [Kitasatospora sp. MAP12-15]|uniref:hypothetical protein n=1 Tax=unclassified Kitasatospora TaxID=2633591 RepID=UPI0024760E1B|nr:hypothetical protein [Kitasatospora sp. MAP12-44]MDH6113076.1 hypothetical protein [Kitasatospora sp. MAP12-44]